MQRPDRTSPPYDAAASPLDVAVLPEPEETSHDQSPGGGADDLIANLADQQIDALMADADLGPSEVGGVEAALEVAQQAAGELTTLEDDLRRSTATLVDEEAASAILDAAVRPAEVVDADSMLDEPPPPMPPSFDPPRQAEIGRDRRSTDAIASSGQPSHETLQSSAEQVARELEADAILTPRGARGAPQPQADPLPSDAWWRAAWRQMSNVPRILLAAINLPVRPLSDTGREAIGAIAIATLANATGLLIYLMLYRR